MRTFAVLFALAMPFLVSAQCADESTTSLCCFNSQDSTVDSLTQLGDLQNTVLPTDVSGSIGLLCSSFDDTCDLNTFQGLCCSSVDPDGVYALGCSAFQPSILGRRHH